MRNCIYVTLCLKIFGPSMLLPGFKFYVVKQNTGYTSRLVFATIIGALMQQLEKIIVSKLLPIASIGLYGFLFSGLSKLRMLPAAIAPGILVQAVAHVAPQALAVPRVRIVLGQMVGLGAGAFGPTPRVLFVGHLGAADAEGRDAHLP